ncbi:substrate-binding periplasmic protein [Roseateles aquae]|nr:transporter substrate-binding domain-containing protein [Paucibacter sp. APW11]
MAPCLALCLALSRPAWADCSRPIVVPVAPTGFNVLVQGEAVSGVYPELLRQLGASSGCEFQFPIVPRARLAMTFFETTQADLFIPASRTAERDQKAVFVPMLKLTPALITLRSKVDLISDVGQLLARSRWLAAVVRSYSWGDEYDALLRQLEADRRVTYVSDLAKVGELLRTGRVDFTILPPTLLYSALQTSAGSAEAASPFRFTALEGLPRSEVGAYLSPRSLSAVDLAQLKTQLAHAASDGRLQQALERYYPAEVLRHDVVLGPIN